MSAFQPRPGLTIYSDADRPIVLDHEIGKGGEGSVWSIAGTTSVAAKFYHNGISVDHARKLDAMCRLKSESLLRIAAWPVGLLKADASGPPEGMLMPRISGYQPAHLLYTPKSRRASFPEAQFPFIVHASLNIARAFATVHDAGQVIGDVNHGNLIISNDATVALIDCDSFEIQDGESRYPCLVGVPTYTPPELQGQSFQRGVQRTAQHDTFGLAVLVFHMLFLGRHPFAGIFRQGSADKTIEDAIREFRFAYLPDRRLTEMDPPPSIPGLAEFPPDVAGLFIRAFNREGASGHRPTAREWIASLENLSRNLKHCTANDSHHYFQALSSCPWCRVEQVFGRPMFGIKITVVSGPDFDLVAVWARIEAVRPTEQPEPLSPAAYADQCTPDTRIGRIKIVRRRKRLFSIGSLLLALFLVLPGQIPALGAICVLFAGISFMARFFRAAKACGGELRSEHLNASSAFDAAMERWKKVQHVPDSFEKTKRGLQAQKEELAGLASVRDARLAQLHGALKQKQLIRFLEAHRIEDATIAGIGPGRKTLLRCYGVEDASDVRPGLDIKGFGPTLKSALLVWRYSIEQRFVYNPNEQIDGADMRALDYELAQKKAALVRGLSSGPQTLRQILLPWQIERANTAEEVSRAAKALAQARVNLDALDSNKHSNAPGPGGINALRSKVFLFSCVLTVLASIIGLLIFASSAPERLNPPQTIDPLRDVKAKGQPERRSTQRSRRSNRKYPSTAPVQKKDATLPDARADPQQP